MFGVGNTWLTNINSMGSNPVQSLNVFSEHFSSGVMAAFASTITLYQAFCVISIVSQFNQLFIINLLHGTTGRVPE